jgi:uroporphyrinogen decarboxylase
MVFRRLIDILVEATVAYLLAQVEAGAEVLQIFDSWAGALAEDDFNAWVIEPTTEIVRRVKAAKPHIPVIGFPRAAGAQYLAYAAETGVDGISLDFGVPLAWAAESFPRGIALQGNLDPALLLVGGAPLDAGVDRIKQAWHGRPFIFNLGHGVMPSTPPVHVARLIARLRATP